MAPASQPLRQVIARMNGYAQVSQPIKPQRRVDQSRAANPERFRKVAEYLATINLSSGMKHEFELKTLPRVKGRGTNVIITEYDLPRATIEPHDVIIVGAGHNGLVAACYLARAGLDVLVLERNPYIGGAAVSRQLYKDFTYSNCSYVCSLLRTEIIRALELPKYPYDAMEVILLAEAAAASAASQPA